MKLKRGNEMSGVGELLILLWCVIGFGGNILYHKSTLLMANCS